MMVSEAHFVSAEAMKNFSWMIDLIEHPKGLGIYPEIDLEDVGSPEAKTYEISRHIWTYSSTLFQLVILLQMYKDSLDQISWPRIG